MPKLGEDLRSHVPRLGTCSICDLQLPWRPAELAELGDLVLELDDRRSKA